METYIKRTYHPFMQLPPSWQQLPCGLIVMWTHSQAAGPIAQPDKHVLGVAIVIPSVQELSEALSALPHILQEQGEHGGCFALVCVAMSLMDSPLSHTVLTFMVSSAAGMLSQSCESRLVAKGAAGIQAVRTGTVHKPYKTHQ